ncbi:MAG: alpha/beta hydrolase [Rikenellaceae bacterium]|nr:alpha/beta hydrolase [Rikenellaceae bacterium]
MKRFLASVFLLAVAAGFSGAQDTGIVKETYRYAVKDGQELMLDKYSPAWESIHPSPCVIFMFGGGFFTGQRDGSYYIPYFRFLVENGYTVISIDYRLGFKDFRDGPPQDTRKMGKIKMAKAFVAAFKNAIDIAVEDLFDATAFIIDRSAGWNIDPHGIIANGSSAGAISVLHGEYAICNGENVALKLPDGFRYAGIISFAGAIFVEARDINFMSPPCPIILFHGSADSNVPYDKIKKLGRGFYGSEHISAKLTRIGAPHAFYSVEGGTHTVAATPMNENREDILSYLDKLVDKSERIIIKTDVNLLDTVKSSHKFRIRDYVKSNFPAGS